MKTKLIFIYTISLLSCFFGKNVFAQSLFETTEYNMQQQIGVENLAKRILSLSVPDVYTQFPILIKGDTMQRILILDDIDLHALYHDVTGKKIYESKDSFLLFCDGIINDSLPEELLPKINNLSQCTFHAVDSILAYPDSLRDFYIGKMLTANTELSQNYRSDNYGTAILKLFRWGLLLWSNGFTTCLVAPQILFLEYDEDDDED